MTISLIPFHFLPCKFITVLCGLYLGPPWEEQWISLMQTEISQSKGCSWNSSINVERGGARRHLVIYLCLKTEEWPCELRHELKIKASSTNRKPKYFLECTEKSCTWLSCTCPAKYILGFWTIKPTWIMSQVKCEKTPSLSHRNIHSQWSSIWERKWGGFRTERLMHLLEKGIMKTLAAKIKSIHLAWNIQWNIDSFSFPIYSVPHGPYQEVSITMYVLN